jgi:hypothetical protein
MSTGKTERACTAELFLKDAGTHTMEVLLDQGVHRHLEFRTNGSSVFYFGLVTWPDHLCVYGDMGTFVFQRVEDMFTFFRNKPDEFKVNARYWAEKVQSDADHKGCTEYSKQLFRETIKERFDNHFDDLDTTDEAEVARRGRIWEEIESEVFSDIEFEHDARRAAEDFECEGFRFRDFWEARLHEYTFHFLWCLYAIVHGIKLYDQAKAPAPTVQLV